MKLIKKIELLESKNEVYWDITIPGNHNYVLDNGNVVHNTGLGFSVERQYVNLLPVIAEDFYESDTSIQVRDSKLGWATSLHELITLLYQGRVPKWDLSKLRPAGARLKTFGGRSSGPDPLNDLFEFCVSTFKKAAGRKLNSLEVHDIMCKIGAIVVVGGVRRSALISLSNLSDDRLRGAKNGQWWEEYVHRALANNSVAYTEKPEIGIFMKEWISLYESKSGERGIFNRVSAIKQSKLTGRRETEEIDFGCNPCVTGDTLVYVADGRGDITIKQLADEGADVPVFCFNTEDNLAIRTMRAPRITGKNVAVYKVTLDDGSIIKATENHKLKLRTGEYKEIKDLLIGDSLKLLTKFSASFDDIFKDRRKSQDYKWLSCGFGFNTTEHRMIAAFYNNIESVPQGYVVHHIDHNASNNHPSNLQIMLQEDHWKLHAGNIAGDKNPMRKIKKSWSKDRWSNYLDKLSAAQTGEKNGNANPITNEQLKEHVLSLTKQLGYRISNNEWQAYAKKHKLPLVFSNYRKNHLGGINGYFKWAAIELELEYVDTDPRTARRFVSLSREGYDCDIINHKILINKYCEVCNEKFVTEHKESGICSTKCANSRVWINPNTRKQRMNSIISSHIIRKQKIAEQQIEIFSELKFILNRAPSKFEWNNECKKRNVSIEISRASSPICSFKKLEELANDFNHKVISIEFCGYEDVYNGTVDDFHNFFIGGFQSSCTNGKSKTIYINNLQCGEIILRPEEFCNLTEVIVRDGDTLDRLKKKVRHATILGTFQSTLTDFRYIRGIWKKNCEEERLLGVSLTGIMDHLVLSGRDGNDKLKQWLSDMKQVAIDTNKEWANKLKINQSTAITTVKPSGTVSQLVNSASGIHPRYSKYYIRTVRQDKKDPLGQFLKDAGIPCEDDITKPDATWVFSFPQKSPDHAIFRDEMSAIEQLEHYLTFKKYWCEHNPSITVYVRQEEWMDVGAWVYKNFDDIGGVSFLPHSDHSYKQAPYQEIKDVIVDGKPITAEEQFKEMSSKMPLIDWESFTEITDNVEGAQELACSGGTCELP